MCGIVGCVVRGSVDVEALARASHMIGHRGPDDSGLQTWRRGDWEVGFANRRLAIVDLTAAGRMPMASPSGNAWITYNGEVYNQHVLRAELEARGMRFRSHTDTEVVAALVERDGPESVGRLNGIFGFALWDNESGRLLLARDRFGIKPLYIAERRDALYFASELKALLCFPDVDAVPDLADVCRAVLFQSIPGQGTGFRGIRKLPPGHLLQWRDGRIGITGYWDPVYAPVPRPEAALVEELRERLFASVRRQLMSDVPVAAFLSGGLDSSAVVAAMAATSSDRVRTFTIAYSPDDGRWEQTPSEAPYARAVARQFGCDYQEIVPRADVCALLPKVVWHLDEPVAEPAAISTYLISAAAKPHATVLMSGQGADELMAGYRLYAFQRLAHAYGRVPRGLRRRVLTPGLGAALAVGAAVAGRRRGLLLAARRHALAIADGSDDSAWVRHIRFRSAFGGAELEALLTPAVREVLAESDPLEQHLAAFRRAERFDGLSQLLYADMRTELVDIILTYADKLGMAASTEVRVPFLDNELVDFALTIPSHMKLRGLTGKYLLKRALEGVLPDHVIWRRKAPFGAPVRAWLRRDLRPLLTELLSDDAVRRRGYFSVAAVHRILSDAEVGRGNSAHQLWVLLTVELWHRVFIDRSISP
jgi:asparagine synthase (glutamine-hydrolysing)